MRQGVYHSTLLDFRDEDETVVSVGVEVLVLSRRSMPPKGIVFCCDGNLMLAVVV